MIGNRGMWSRQGSMLGASLKWLLSVWFLALLVGCGPSSAAKSAYATEAARTGLKTAMQAQKLLEKNDMYGAIRLFEGWGKELDVLIRKVEKDPMLNPGDREEVLHEFRKQRDVIKAGVKEMSLAALDQP